MSGRVIHGLWAEGAFNDVLALCITERRAANFRRYPAPCLEGFFCVEKARIQRRRALGQSLGIRVERAGAAEDAADPVAEPLHADGHVAASGV